MPGSCFSACVQLRLPLVSSPVHIRTLFQTWKAINDIANCNPYFNIFQTNTFRTEVKIYLSKFFHCSGSSWHHFDIEGVNLSKKLHLDIEWIKNKSTNLLWLIPLQGSNQMANDIGSRICPCIVNHTSSSI